VRAVGSFLFLLLLLFAPASEASADGRWSFGLGAGWLVFDSDYGTRFHGNPEVIPRDAVEYGGRISRTWNHGVGLELAGGWCPTRLQMGGTDIATLHASFASLRLVVDPEPGRWGAPFLGVGGSAGILYVTHPEPGFAAPWVVTGPDSFRPAFYPPYLDLAAGWTIRLSNPVHLRLEARKPVWLHRETGSSSASDPGMIAFGAVLTFHAGTRGQDTDGDGVSDRKDRCPDTPPGARVDHNGCPLDSDGDGVFDGLDFCPETPAGALVDERGCALDSDHDGVVDGVDRCPNTNRQCAVNALGCPIDADSDGVCDALDRCPATPHGFAVNDEGCPLDSDRDGIPDGADQCPGTAAGAKVDGNGCPLSLIEMENELVRTGKARIPIPFEVGRADLLAENDATLDLLAQLLGRWPTLSFAIDAHTGRNETSGGTDLGDRRARAIRDDVTRRLTVNPGAKIAARGYGPASGIHAGAAPPWVELVALDSAALRREAERRGLVKPAPPAPRPAPARPVPKKPTGTRR